MQTLPTSKASALASQLFGVFTCVTQGSESSLVAVAAELDLSLSQIRALLVMWQASQPLSLGELARGVGLSDAATVRVVDRLISAGLADRREDARDRRIKRISLSAFGDQTVNRLVDAKRAGLERFAESLTPQERERLTAALEPIVDRLGLGCDVIS
jgi:DNA-binding MarR family transcriptional regulator